MQRQYCILCCSQPREIRHISNRRSGNGRFWPPAAGAELGKIQILCVSCIWYLKQITYRSHPKQKRLFKVKLVLHFLLLYFLNLKLSRSVYKWARIIQRDKDEWMANNDRRRELRLICPADSVWNFANSIWPPTGKVVTKTQCRLTNGLICISLGVRGCSCCSRH